MAGNIVKLLCVIPSYWPALQYGGPITASHALNRALVKKGVDVTVYTTNSDNPRMGYYLDVQTGQGVAVGGIKVYYLHCNFSVRNGCYSQRFANLYEKNYKAFLFGILLIMSWLG